jgi:nicotinamide-nucleotide adenylyltransferase
MAARNKHLLAFFSRSLNNFQSSSSPFQILYTLLPHEAQQQLDNPGPLPPSQPVPHLTILDSSFNPPTAAHRDMALSATTSNPSSSPSRILLLLAVQNADKAPRPAPFEQRLCMMEALAREILLHHHDGTGAGSVAAVDVGVTTQPYFHDKARAVRESGFYAGLGDMTFLAGFDTLIRVLNPRYYGGEEGMAEALDPFFGMSKLRVTMRPGGGWGGVEEQEGYLGGLQGGRGYRTEWSGRIEMVEGSGGSVGVSSSRVRELVSQGKTQDLESLVGRDVEQFIRVEELYKEG